MMIVLIDKYGKKKQSTLEEDKIADLYKKCGFKKPDGFELQTTWNVTLQGIKYEVELYAKNKGKATTENKYDFPPPVDTILFFGSVALVGYVSKVRVSLSLDLWEKIYEKLFGGFETLKDTEEADEEEEDELSNIDHSLLTGSGYLKDGFVVDSDTEVDMDMLNIDSDLELSEESYEEF